MAGRSTVDREKDYRALEMVRRGLSYRQVAKSLGWSSPQSVGNAIKRALRELTQVDADQLIKVMRARLDDYRQQAWRVLATTHYVTSQSGAVVMNPANPAEPLIDQEPILRALDRLLRYDIEERRMLGLDAPTRSRVEVITEDAVDAEIRRLEAKMAADAAAGKRADRTADTSTG